MPGLVRLSWDIGLNALVAEWIEAIVFRTVNDQPTLWDSILPSELLVLPDELARVDALLDGLAFFASFVPYFDPEIGALDSDGDLSTTDVLEVPPPAGL